jgi:hemerythrin-like domain-containing protein
MRPVLHAEAAPDFGDPLGLLSACHRRMVGFCELLSRMPSHLAKRGIDTEALDAARRVVRYFDLAAPLHHLDEECDLFPLLTGTPPLGPLVDRLRAQHRELEREWLRLAEQLRRLDDGVFEAAAFRDAAETFCRSCREHIDTEETQLLPAARSRLEPDQLRRLGQAMARRRGHETSAIQ